MIDNSKSTITRRLEEMLTLQDSVNSLINPTWRDAHNPWYRAVWTECAELLDHISWKWWKKQVPDAEQIELELVDIFHFGLSFLLQQGSVEAVLIQCQATYIEFAITTLTESDVGDCKVNLVENFALDVLNTQCFSLRAFFELSRRLGLSELSLYEHYIGKNVLNKFRQDFGYKNGKYIKIWHGREDNEWLMEIAAKIDKNPATFASEIYSGLAKIYAGVSLGN